MLNLLTVKVLVRRKVEIKTMVNLMELQLIKGTARLSVGKRQVRELLMLLSDVLVMEGWAILLVNARVLARNISSVESQDTVLLIVRVIC